MSNYVFPTAEDTRSYAVAASQPSENLGRYIERAAHMGQLNATFTENNNPELFNELHNKPAIAIWLKERGFGVTVNRENRFVGERYISRTSVITGYTISW